MLDVLLFQTSQCLIVIDVLILKVLLMDHLDLVEDKLSCWPQLALDLREDTNAHVVDFACPEWTWVLAHDLSAAKFLETLSILNPVGELKHML